MQQPQTKSAETPKSKATNEGLTKLRELVEGISVAMLTTSGADGALYTRPMAHQQLDENGDLWFFTRSDSPKSAELEQNPNVNVAYNDAKKGVYISVCGTAEQLKDKAKAKELWTPAVSAWFPDGLEDPSLTLIRVHAESAEYWEQTAGFVVRMIEIAKSAVTGKTPDIGENRVLNLN